MIEDEMSVLDVGEMKDTEANEPEREVLVFTMAESNERGLELFDMVEGFALVKQ